MRAMLGLAIVLVSSSSAAIAQDAVPARPKVDLEYSNDPVVIAHRDQTCSLRSYSQLETLEVEDRAHGVAYNAEIWGSLFLTLGEAYWKAGCADHAELSFLTALNDFPLRPKWQEDAKRGLRLIRLAEKDKQSPEPK